MVSWRTQLRRLRSLVAQGLIVVFAWYATSRVMSSGRAVEIRAHPAENDAPNSQHTGPLRVGVYNIAHGRGSGSSNWGGGSANERRERLEAIARFLKRQRLDVVVLNEVDFETVWSGHVNQAEAIAAAAGFPYWAEQRNVDAAIPFCAWRFGNAVLSRHPIRSARLVELPAYAVWESVLAGQKQGLVCEIEPTGGKPLRVFAVHLEHRSEEVRVRSARWIEQVRRQSPLPLVCAGDFNSSPRGFPGAVTDASGTTAMSVLEAGGYRLPLAAFSAERTTFSTREPNRIIDWILPPPDWAIESYEVPHVRWSDHRPVIATLRAR